MDIPLQLPTTIYGWISIVTAISVAVLVIRRGDITSLRQANEDLRTELADKQRLIEGLQKQLNDLKDQLSKLSGVMQEKDKRIESLEHVQVIQAPSPEVLSYMADVRNFMGQVHSYMVDTTKTLETIKGDKNVK